MMIALYRNQTLEREIFGKSLLEAYVRMNQNGTAEYSVHDRIE